LHGVNDYLVGAGFLSLEALLLGNSLSGIISEFLVKNIARASSTLEANLKVGGHPDLLPKGHYSSNLVLKGEAGIEVKSQYCSLRYFRWFFDGWRTVKLHNGRSRAFVWCVGRVSAFHHPRLACSTAGFTQQLCGRLKEQPIPCFLAHRGEWPQIGAGCDAITAPWP